MYFSNYHLGGLDLPVDATVHGIGLDVTTESTEAFEMFDLAWDLRGLI